MTMRPNQPFRNHRRTRCSGIVAIEFALVAPLILLLLAGALDFGRLVRTSVCVADAARAGAQYGSLTFANSSDISGMQTAALNAAPDVTGMTATAVKSCQCPGGASVSCGGSCTGGKMMVYVQVTAQVTCNAVFSYPGLPFSGAVSSRASMRAQ